MIDEALVRDISEAQGEPEWMLRFRLRALDLYRRLPEPRWLRGVEDLDVEELIVPRPEGSKAERWEDLPENVRRVYEALKLPEYEAKVLAGLATSWDADTMYARVLEDLRRKGVVFLPMDEAVRRYPDLVRRYFGRIFPAAEHKYSALHYALWSGGVFLYVPPGVRIEAPIEAFFYISSAREGQFEHTIVVADKNAYVHFIEGCAAPVFRRFSFHDGAVEVYVHEGAHVKFTTVQNWSKEIINFNNKRGIVERNGVLEWVEGSIGARVSVVYPSAVLRGEGARTTMHIFSLARGTLKDGGAKIFHVAPNTRSTVVSKGVSAEGGVNIYRGLVRISRGAKNAFAHVSCDSLIMDGQSEASTYPHAQIEEKTAVFTHEATTLRFPEEALFYMRSRGIDEEKARALAVIGFISDVMRGLPFEYAAVLRRVVELDFGGAVG